MIENKIAMISRYEIAGAEEISVFHVQLKCVLQPVADVSADGNENGGQVCAAAQIDLGPDALEVTLGIEWQSSCSGLDIAETSEKYTGAVAQIERNFDILDEVVMHDTP